MSAAKRRPTVSAEAESVGEKALPSAPLARTALWHAKTAPAGEQVPKAGWSGEARLGET